MQKKIYKILILLLLALFMVLAIIYFFTGDYSYFKAQEAQKEKRIIEERIKLAKQKLAEKKQAYKNLKNKDKFEIEKLAREKDMIKPGEKVYKYRIKKEGE